MSQTGEYTNKTYMLLSCLGNIFHVTGSFEGRAPLWPTGGFIPPRWPGKSTESSEIWQLRLTSSRKLHIFVNAAMEVPRNKSSGGQLNLSLLIKMLSIAIKSFFRKGIKLLLTPRKFVKYLMPFLRRLLIISGLMILYHPTTIPMKDFQLSLNGIVITRVSPR